MSRGPGAVERGVLDALARYGPMNATELAQDIFGLWERLELEPTLAQLGSVQRAIRHLAARGVIVEYYSGRKYWQLPEPEKRGSWSEEIFRLLATPKIWRKTKDCLAIAPARDIDRIAGSDKQRLPITGDPTRRPDTAAPPAGAPADDVAGVAQADADDPAAIIPAIAEMPTKGDIDPSVENGERAALVLVARIEALAVRRECLGNIDRPTRQWRAVLQRQGKDTVARSANICNHRVAVDRLGRLVDNRGAGDAERIDVAARQARERDRTAQRTSPNLPTRGRIDRLDIVVFGSDQKLSR